MHIIKKYYPWLTGLFVFIIYLFTLAPSVAKIDAGELATVQYFLGIAHPSGYPLFTLLGYLFSHLPISCRIIYKLNLLAALYASLGIVFFVYTVKTFLENLEKFAFNKISTNTKKQFIELDFAHPDRKSIMISSVFGGFILAFSKTYWLQSTAVEVYSLHLCLINLIIFIFLKAYFNNALKDWLLFAGVFALGFTNHLTTFLIGFGCTYLYFDKKRFYKDSWITIIKMLLVFFPVLILVYSYLYVRANQNPILNWGNPENLTNLLRHINGWQ